MEERIRYFDFIRGVAILMVVAIHTYSVGGGNVSLALRQPLNLAVPLFLAISGFFLSRKKVNVPGAYVSFLRHQIPKIYIPCLFWSLPLFLMETVMYGVCLQRLVMLFICGFSIYYFVALIIQYYLLLPLMQRFRNFQSVFCLISALSIIVVTYIVNVKGISVPLIIYAGPAPVWIAFFSLGVFLGMKPRDYKLGLYIVATLICLTLSFFESKCLMSFSGGGAGIKLSSFAYSYFAILVLFSNKCETFLFRACGRFFSWISRVGDRSYGIYLVHCYFILFFRKFYEGWNLLYWPFRWLVVVLISFVFAEVVRRLFPRFSYISGMR